MSGAPSEPVVGPGGCVLHIGLMKTATTAVQGAASSRRSELLEQGVRYPGTGLNHSFALSSVLGRAGMNHAADTHPARWEELVTETSAHPQDRLFLSSELVAGTHDEAITTLIDQFGPEIHVVATVRPLAQLLPSAWQQYVKQRSETVYRHWMKRVVEDRDSSLATRVWSKYGIADALEPWVARLGSARVTAVMLDKSRPELVYEAFEGLLGVPAGLLRSEGNGDRANRGLSHEEVELVRHVNRVVREGELSPEHYRTFVRFALADGIQQGRRPGPGEHRLRIPPPRLEGIREIALEQVARTKALGVSVVGDLEAYAAMPPLDTRPLPPVTHVPADLVERAVECVVTARPGSGRRSLEPIAPVGDQDQRAWIDVDAAAEEVGAAILTASAELTEAAESAPDGWLQRAAASTRRVIRGRRPGA